MAAILAHDKRYAWCPGTAISYWACGSWRIVDPAASHQGFKSQFRIRGANRIYAIFSCSLAIRPSIPRKSLTWLRIAAKNSIMIGYFEGR